MDGTFRVYKKQNFKANDFHHPRMSGGSGRLHSLLESLDGFDVWSYSEWSHYPNGNIAKDKQETFVAVDELPEDAPYGLKVEVLDGKIVRFVYPEHSSRLPDMVLLECRLESFDSDRVLQELGVDNRD